MRKQTRRMTLLVAVVAALASAAVAAAATVVVAPGQTSGWAVVNDTCGAATTGSVAFVSGPATPPAGAGSAQFTVGSNGDSYPTRRTRDSNGVAAPDPLMHLTELEIRVGLTQNLYDGVANHPEPPSAVWTSSLISASGGDGRPLTKDEPPATESRNCVKALTTGYFLRVSSAGVADEPERLQRLPEAAADGAQPPRLSPAATSLGRWPRPARRRASSTVTRLAARPSATAA